MSQAEPSHLSAPRILLHIEGAILFAVAVIAYIYLHGNGWLFLFLILAPDLSMVGYLRNPALGSITYNAVHAYILPALLLGIGLITGTILLVEIALIWFAHIGMDRAVGYGLKYPTAFQDTHLGRV